MRSPRSGCGLGGTVAEVSSARRSDRADRSAPASGSGPAATACRIAPASSRSDSSRTSTPGGPPARSASPSLVPGRARSASMPFCRSWPMDGRRHGRPRRDGDGQPQRKVGIPGGAFLRGPVPLPGSRRHVLRGQFLRWGRLAFRAPLDILRRPFPGRVLSVARRGLAGRGFRRRASLPWRLSRQQAISCAAISSVARSASGLPCRLLLLGPRRRLRRPSPRVPRSRPRPARPSPRPAAAPRGNARPWAAAGAVAPVPPCAASAGRSRTPPRRGARRTCPARPASA